MHYKERKRKIEKNYLEINAKVFGRENYPERLERSSISANTKLYKEKVKEIRRT